MRREDRDVDAYLRAQIDAGETILAAGPQGIVTERRIVFGWRLYWPPHAGEWTHDALAFEEITEWQEGRRHDQRPLIRLLHPIHRRLEWIPGHRFLWFRWGNATAELPHGETTFSFRSVRDPVYRAMKAHLAGAGPAQGASFTETPPGTRQERVQGGVAVLQYSPRRFGGLGTPWHRLVRLDHDLHHGGITWWIRVGSWALLAVPVAFVHPWLVPPAVLAVEVAWVAGLQWSWYRDRHRHRRGARP